MDHNLFLMGGADVMNRPSPPPRPSLEQQRLFNGFPAGNMGKGGTSTGTDTGTGPTATTLPGSMEVQSMLRSTDDNNGDQHTLNSPTEQQLRAFNAMASQANASTSSSSTSTSRPRQQTVGHEAPGSKPSLERSSSRTNKSKRFSLTFPIHASSNSISSRTSSPTRVTPSTPLPESAASPTGPSDSNFLTAIAAQERRVLELKEELQKAEQELRKLKHEWAYHEAQRKRHDVRRVQKLQPLNVGMISPTFARSNVEEDSDGSSAWMHAEMERRKALLSGSKPSNRTVFSGSRHARALSLLSPDLSAPSSVAFLKIKPHERSSSEAVASSATLPKRPPPVLRTSTDPDLTDEVVNNVDTSINLGGLPQDVLLKTGRQMASDFREGLWTFIEDLRQATVGDEGINGTTSRTLGQGGQAIPPGQKALRQQPSRGSLKRPQPLKRSSTTGSTKSKSRSPTRYAANSTPSEAAEALAWMDVGNSFWKDQGLEEPKASAPAHKTHKKSSGSTTTLPIIPSSTPIKPAKHTSTTSIDGWETWDGTSDVQGHKASRSNSETSIASSTAHTSPSPNGTSPRTSMSSYRDSVAQAPSTSQDRGKRDSIPWPALNKLAPSQLRRTASNLMADWERCVTPAAEESGNQGEFFSINQSKMSKED